MAVIVGQDEVNNFWHLNVKIRVAESRNYFIKTKSMHHLPAALFLENHNFID